MVADVRMFGRYALGLGRYLRHPLGPDECREAIGRQLANREESFLAILRRGVYAQSESPYRKLLDEAGIACEDVARLVRLNGLESALKTMYDAGVYVTLDEFKGRQPIRRGRLQLPVKPSDFDNPLLARHYEGRSGGTRGSGTRVIIDFDLLAHEAAYIHHFLQAFDLAHRPIGSWRPVPLVTSGMKLLLRYAKLGRPVEKWFAPNRLRFTRDDWRYAVFTHYTLAAGRLFGAAMPRPEFTPLTDALRVAKWLVAKKAARTPALMDTNASSGVRVCQAAREQGLDIAGTFFRLGGEPYTRAKAEIVAAAGCRAACHYSISEIGIVAMACGDPADLDDMHLLEDKLAAIQIPRTVDRGTTVPALVYTTLLPSCPKLMLNVESGDYATLERRPCGCPFGVLGLHHHVRQVRSYEKLCSEGLTFLGTELHRLVEEVLPAHFGGDFTDYQLVETEDDHGLPKVSILVSPRRGPVDEARVLATVLQLLSSYPGGQIMAQQWQEVETLRVLRREPYSTGSAKIMPLHFLSTFRL